MKSILACALLLAICVTQAHSQDPRQEFRRPFGREEIKQRVPTPPPVQTTLITMTGQHEPIDVTTMSTLSLLVPVRLERLDPAITRARILCDASFELTFAPNRPLTHVGRGYSPELEIVNGALSDTLPVPLEALPGKELRSARSYHCILQLKIADTWLPAYGAAETYPVDLSQPFRHSAANMFPR